MNYLKIIEHIAGFSALCGFMLLVGTVGSMDYLDEIHQYYSLTQFIPQLLIGTLLMLPIIIWEKVLDNYYFDEGNDEDD